METKTKTFKDPINELVMLRVLHCPNCGTLIYWINPRFPNYCPECGKHIYPRKKDILLNHQLFAGEVWMFDKERFEKSRFI